MSISLFGLFWLAIVAVAFIKSRKATAVVYLWSFIFQANCFLIIGSQSIALSVITGIVLIIRCLLQECKIHSNPCFKAWLEFFVIAVIISLLASKLFVGEPIFSDFEANGLNVLHTVPYDGSAGIYRFIILLVYILASYYAGRSLKDGDRIIRELKKMTIVVLGIGALQYFIVFFQLPIRELFEAVFRSDIACVPLSVYYGRARLFSCFIEPSYCALFLVASFWVSIIAEKKYGMKKLIPFIVLEIALTYSTTAYVSVVLGSIVYLVLSENKTKSFFYIVLLAIIFIAVVGGTGYLSVISEVVFQKITGSNSGATRSSWNKVAWGNFLHTYGLGMGYRTVRASSLLINLLAQVGVLGTVLFIRSMIFTIMPCINKTKRTNESICSALFLAMVLIGELIACPDLDNVVLWLAISMCMCMREYVYSSDMNGRVLYYD